MEVANLEVVDEDQGQFGGDGSERDVEVVAAPDTTVARGRGGTVTTSQKAADPARQEAALMTSAQSREHMTYDKHKDKVIVLEMSWQDFYDNSLRKPPDGGMKVRLPVAQFIHVDPWYDADTLSAEDLRKFRKLIDGMAQVGTKLLLWGNFFGLNFWIRMLAGEYNTPKPNRLPSGTWSRPQLCWCVLLSATCRGTVAGPCGAIVNLPSSQRSWNHEQIKTGGATWQPPTTPTKCKPWGSPLDWPISPNCRTIPTSFWSTSLPPRRNGSRTVGARHCASWQRSR